MLNENFLMDDYSVRGNSFEELKKIIEEFEQVTQTKKVFLPNITVYSIDKTGESNIELVSLKPNEIYVNIPTTSGKSLRSFKNVSLNKRSILNKGNFVTVLGEMEKTHQPIMGHEDSLFFTSANIWKTLSARISFKGDFFVENSFERDLGLAKCFENSTKAITLTIREINGVKKIFSFLSEKYTYIPQTILLDVIHQITDFECLGRLECVGWNIDHYITEVYIAFPDRAKEFQDLYCMPNDFVPGLYLATGGTGDCSLKARGFWKKRNSVIIQSEVIQKHVGEINLTELLKDIETQVFDEFIKLPEALCKLIGIDISDNEWDSLSPEEYEKRNLNRLSYVIQKTFKELGFVSAITKNREKQLREQVMLEFNMSEHYTAFDIAMKIMDLPERIEGLGKVYEEPFSKACCKAAYVDYEKLIKKSEDSESKKLTIK